MDRPRRQSPERCRLAGTLLAVLVALLLCAGCDPTYDMAIGANDEVTLFSDFAAGDEREDLLHEFIVRPREAPVRPEALYRVDRGDPGSFRSQREWRNLVFLGDMGSGEWCARHCERVLGSEGRGRLASAAAGYALARDHWVRGQTLLFVHARDPEALTEMLAREGDALLAQLHDHVVRGLQQTLYAGGEQEKLQRGIFERHGYRLRIPADFAVQEQAANRFVRILRVEPDEPATFLFVYYQDQIDPRLSPAYCMAIRDTLGIVYLHGERIEPSRTRVASTRFLGREALEIYGLYQSDEPVMGGPFRTFCFHAGGRLYLVDTSVFNPPRSKAPQLRLLEAIARTLELPGAPE